MKKMLPRVNRSVQTLLRMRKTGSGEVVEEVWRTVRELQEEVHQQGIARRYPCLHEVICFLYLGCFSLLHLEGESFDAYQQELQVRYKILLRRYSRFPRFVSGEKRVHFH